MNVLCFKPSIEHFGVHDSSAAIFIDNDLIHAVEEERFTRSKHAPNTFPINSINHCLNECGLEMSDIDEIRVPYLPKNKLKTIPYESKHNVLMADSILDAAWNGLNICSKAYKLRFRPVEAVEDILESNFESQIPEIKTFEHHLCHAASAFIPSPYNDALAVTIDGSGEHDSTVVWECHEDNIQRIKTYNRPNSLGRFYGAITEFLGFRRFNGEGKVMGLAPYGSMNKSIEQKFRQKLKFGADYNVTPLTDSPDLVGQVEKLFNKKRIRDTNSYDQWCKDLAYVTQSLLEETVVDIVEQYTKQTNKSNVVLAGGVALNCKMNKRVMELPDINVFIQPVAHDGGLAIGAGYIGAKSSNVSEMSDLYYGCGFSNDYIEDVLEKNKIKYERPQNISECIAKELSNGKIVARFSGRMEMGPRALGNRSILADPRSKKSRDRVNKFVKHREEWRPFAPSILKEYASEYLIDSETAPYMITTFNVNEEMKPDIEAVLHPADNTTRPQTVSREQNSKYYDIISEFNTITGVPVVLNTSFNDHGEPIVRTPTEAIKDFYGMGLDTLILEDFVIRK